MKPVIAGTEKHESVKPVALKLIDDNGSVSLIAANVKNEGDIYLIVFEENKAMPIINAKILLERNGYDTTFTEWDEYGAMVLS